MYKPRALVVEDNLINMDLLCLLLERMGYEIFQARDGLSGLQLARREQPDLILLDLALPELDGWTVAEELKSDILTQAIPIVAITANSMPEDRERAFAAGCNGFIAKPFHIATFNAEIERVTG